MLGEALVEKVDYTQYWNMLQCYESTVGNVFGLRIIWDYFFMFKFRQRIQEAGIFDVVYRSNTVCQIRNNKMIKYIEHKYQAFIFWNLMPPIYFLLFLFQSKNQPVSPFHWASDHFINSDASLRFISANGVYLK